MLEYLCLGAGLYCSAFGVAALALTRRRDRKLVEAEAGLERRWEAFRAADHSVEANLLAADCKLQAAENLFQAISEKHRRLVAEVTKFAEIHEGNVRLGRQIDGFLDDFAPVIAALDGADDAPPIKPVILPFGQDTPSQV